MCAICIYFKQKHAVAQMKKKPCAKLCACMYVCTYVCMYVHIQIYKSIQIMYTYKYMCIQIHVYAHAYIDFACLREKTSAECMHVCMCRMYVCTYMQIATYSAKYPTLHPV